MVLNLLLDRRSHSDNDTSFFSLMPCQPGEVTIPCEASFMETENLDDEDALIQRIKSAKLEFALRGIAVNLALDAVCTGGGSVSRGFRFRFSPLSRKDR